MILVFLVQRSRLPAMQCAGQAERQQCAEHRCGSVQRFSAAPWPTPWAGAGREVGDRHRAPCRWGRARREHPLQKNTLWFILSLLFIFYAACACFPLCSNPFPWKQLRKQALEFVKQAQGSESNETLLMRTRARQNIYFAFHNLYSSGIAVVCAIEAFKVC